jgi:uroporphyrinogen-III synthase
MSLLGADLARRSAEQRSAAAALLETADFTVSPKSQCLFVVGMTSANILEALGEIVDFQSGMDKLSAAEVKVREIQEKSNALRTAAALGHATGDWSKFDALVAKTVE